MCRLKQARLEAELKVIFTPCKYRVVVELKKSRKNLLKGKFDSLNSPFIVEIDRNSKPIVIDLAMSEMGARKQR